MSAFYPTSGGDGSLCTHLRGLSVERGDGCAVSMENFQTVLLNWTYPFVRTCPSDDDSGRVNDPFHAFAGLLQGVNGTHDSPGSYEGFRCR